MNSIFIWPPVCAATSFAYHSKGSAEALFGPHTCAFQTVSPGAADAMTRPAAASAIAANLLMLVVIPPPTRTLVVRHAGGIFGEERAAARVTHQLLRFALRNRGVSSQTERQNMFFTDLGLSKVRVRVFQGFVQSKALG